MNFSEKARQAKEWWRLVNLASKQRAIVCALTIQKNLEISKNEIVNEPLSALFNWGIYYPYTVEYTINQAQERYNELVQQRHAAWKELVTFHK